MHSTEHHRKLNSPEAAEYLGISVSTLSKRRVDGDGPQYLKPGDASFTTRGTLMLGLIRAVEPQLPTVTPRLMGAAHAHARPG